MKLSLLITYHDEGAWLTECLHSVLPQLASDDEVIIYDDASSRTRAQDHITPDARLRIIRGEHNIGPARARNELLNASRNEFVHFHDADDLFAPEWRARVAAAFDDETDVLFTGVASFDAAGRRYPDVLPVGELLRSNDLLGFALRGSVLVPAATYRRALVEAVGGYRSEMWQSEDYDFHIRLALITPRWKAVEADLVLIRRHPAQRSHNMHEVWAAAIDALEHAAASLPPHAYPDAAYAATRAGSVLFGLGNSGGAARAFELAQRFGGIRYNRRGMQQLARVLGAVQAERLAALYRGMLPRGLRGTLQRIGI